jgi:hypothetical protein
LSYGDVVDCRRRDRAARDLRRALSPTFWTGDLVIFIPWRVVAAQPARRRLIGAVFVDAVGDFFLVIMRIAAAMEPGRSAAAS